MVFRESVQVNRRGSGEKEEEKKVVRCRTAVSVVGLRITVETEMSVHDFDVQTFSARPCVKGDRTQARVPIT